MEARGNWEVIFCGSRGESEINLVHSLGLLAFIADELQKWYLCDELCVKSSARSRAEGTLRKNWFVVF